MTTMRLHSTLMVALAAALAAAGCTTAGPDFKRPDAPTVSRYTPDTLALEAPAGAASAASAASGAATFGQQRMALGQPLDKEWWKLFKSDAFDGVVQRALAGNQTLAMATSSLAQAQEAVNAATGKLDPQVTLNTGTGREKYGAAFLGSSPKPPTFTYFSVGPTVSYTLDYMGGAGRSVEQQRALAEYRQHQFDAAQLSVTGNTVTQALRIASMRAQIATVESLLDRDRENLRLVQVSFDAGSVARLDIVSARSQIASDEALLPPLRQQLSAARHALSLLMGSAPADGKVPDFDIAQLVLPTDLPVSLPSELAHRRPDILAAEAQLHASTAAVGVATANLYPHLDLTANTGQQAVTIGALLNKASNVFGFAGTLVAPILDGGTLRAEKRAAVDAMQSSAANYQQTVLEAFGQVADSLEALEHGAQELQAHQRAQDAAQEDVDLTRRSYQEGNVGVLQVLDAERRYQQARLAFVRAQAQRYIDTVQLFLALGGAGPDSHS
jgi:NodT family efflux transporter outer membrane factor (OMF) lipoprotein